MLGENPRCQVGTIKPTDMPDGSGQQLRAATMVLGPSRLTTWPTWQLVQCVGLASQSSTLAVTHPSINQGPTLLNFKDVWKPNALCARPTGKVQATSTLQGAYSPATIFSAWNCSNTQAFAVLPALLPQWCYSTLHSWVERVYLWAKCLA